MPSSCLGALRLGEQPSTTGRKLHWVLLEGHNGRPGTSDPDDVGTTPSTDDKCIPSHRAQVPGQLLRKARMLLGRVDGDLPPGSTPGSLGTHIVGEHQVVPEDGILLGKEELPFRWCLLVTNKHHLHGKDVTIRAFLVLARLVNIHGVDTRETAFLHEGLDAWRVGPMDHQGDDGLIALVDDRELQKKGLQLIVGQQHIPFGETEAERHVPEDEVYTHANHY